MSLHLLFCFRKTFTFSIDTGVPKSTRGPQTHVNLGRGLQIYYVIITILTGGCL